MNQPNRILVFQTAFLGDVILTLPLVQVLHRKFPHAHIDFLTTPRAAEILRNHPAIHTVLEYDKRGDQRGVGGLLSISRLLRSLRYDVALVPHRSLRSAAIAAMSGIPIRAGFSTSAGRFLFTDIVVYEKNSHEIRRNLAFLKIFNIESTGKEFPALYPSNEDAGVIDQFLTQNKILDNEKIVALAPGSVWNTKRWLPERFSELAKNISNAGRRVVLVGGKEDEHLCREIEKGVMSANIFVAAGKLSVLQSAELLRRCKALVTNDSAPLHLAVAMRTPVVAIFGATAPSFGFAPYGDHDVVVETKGLTCRPCSIHGGAKCPIGTFECMVKISADTVFERVMQL